MPNWLTILFAFLIGIGSWGALFYLTTYYVPDLATIALSLLLVFTAVTGTVMPPIHLLNRRFGSKGEAENDPHTRDRWRTLRQSALVGLLAILCLWFQLLRVLNWIIVALLAGVLVLIEIFFRTRGD